MKQYKVAILGATGAVGREMMKVLAERDFPVSELHLLASARSAGEVLPWKGRDITVELACDAAFEGMDIVLGAAENDIAKRFAPAIVRAGAVFVDNSSAFRMDPDVPLVVPEINPEDVKKHKGIIANPNCTTIVSLVAINALNQDSPIESIVASSYQAVSGAGAGGPIELMNEVEALGLGQQIEPKVFQYQIAYNVIPQEATLGANMRFIPHQGEQESLAIIQTLAEKHGLSTEVLHANDFTPPVDIHGEAFTLFTRVIGETFPGLAASPYVMTGATDAQFYQPICKSCIRFAPVIYGPEQMRGMHGLNENIEYRCLPGAVRFYQNLIRAEK